MFKTLTMTVNGSEVSIPVDERESDLSFEPIADPYATDIWDELDSMSEPDRYEKLLELEVQGHLIPKRFLGFMRYFEFTDRFERRRDYYQSMREVFASMHVCEAEGGE